MNINGTVNANDHMKWLMKAGTAASTKVARKAFFELFVKSFVK